MKGTGSLATLRSSTAGLVIALMVLVWAGEASGQEAWTVETDEECDSDLDGAVLYSAVGAGMGLILGATLGTCSGPENICPAMAGLGAVAGFIVGLADDSTECTPSTLSADRSAMLDSHLPALSLARPQDDSRTGDVVGAIVGAAVLGWAANGWACGISESSDCGVVWEVALPAAAIGGIIGAGIGSTF